MIQQFIESLFIARKSKTLRQVILLFLVLLFIILTICYGVKTEKKIDSAIDIIFQFSGIFSAMLITFIISKMVQLREERVNRRKDVLALSYKITDFRRIAEILLSCYNLWGKELYGLMQGKYKRLTLFDLECGYYSTRSPVLKSTLDDFSENPKLFKGKLYLDMRSLVNNNGNTWSGELYGTEEHDIIYPLGLLEQWLSATNGNYLWYCFAHEWGDYEKELDLSNIDYTKQTQILDLCKRINPSKYSKRVFDRLLLADIGSDFYSYFLPKMHRLVEENTSGLPKALAFLTRMLYVIVIFGLIVPLIITVFNFPVEISSFLLNLSISFLLLSLISLIFSFKGIVENEIVVE